MNHFSKTALLSLFIVGAITNVFAQQNQSLPESKSALRNQDSVAVYDRPNILKTNLTGPFSLLYEAQVLSRQSLQISINCSSFKFLGDDDKFFILTGAYKFYFSKKESTERRPHPAGFYVSPYLRYVNVRNIGSGLFSGSKLSEVAYNLFGGGATVGYQLIFRKGLTLDFFAGGGYLPFSSSKVLYTYSSTYAVDVNPSNYKADFRLGLCIGYAFKKNNKP
jgi:hypothetical protein